MGGEVEGTNAALSSLGHTREITTRPQATGACQRAPLHRASAAEPMGREQLRTSAERGVLCSRDTQGGQEGRS